MRVCRIIGAHTVKYYYESTYFIQTPTTVLTLPKLGTSANYTLSAHSLQSAGISEKYSPHCGGRENACSND